MNAPAPGWSPDPTGRHEYRYWDGGAWTDDVSDAGTTSVDPVGGPAPIGGDPTARIDATQQHAPQPGPQAGGFGPQPGGPGYDPYSSSGQLPPVQPVTSGPSTGLLVGLAAVAVALIVGIAYLVTSGDDDGDTATEETSQTSDDTTGDTSSDDTSTDDTSEDDLDVDLDDIDEDTSDDAIVDLMAAGIESSANGQITTEQAECAAQAMVDELGLETILEMSTSGTDPFADGSMSTEDQVAIVSAMTECIPIDVLIEMGVDADG